MHNVLIQVHQKRESQQCEEGRRSNGRMVGKFAAIEKQSTITMTTADLILKNKESAKQSGAVTQNLKKPNLSGPRRKLFLVDEDNDEDDNPTSQDMNEEQDCVENEDIDEMIYENIQNGIEVDDVRCQDVDAANMEQDDVVYEDEDVNAVDMEEDGVEYEDEDHLIVHNESDNEDEELVVKQHEGPEANETRQVYYTTFLFF